MRVINRSFLIAVLLIHSLFVSSQNVVGRGEIQIDSLVSILEKSSSYRWFYPKDSVTLSDRFLLIPGSDMVKSAITILESKGYSVSVKDNFAFILRDIGISTGVFSEFVKGRVGTSDEESDKFKEAIVYSRVEEAALENKLYEIGDRSVAKRSGVAYVRGTIKDAATGEPIVGAAIYSPEGNIYASTDQHGFYAISLPVGESELKLSGYALEDMSLNIKVYSDGELNVVMREKVETLIGAVISAESSNKIKRGEIGLDIVRIDRIRHIPVVFGEADVLKIIQTLPGVKSVGEASSGFNVRGGSTDQNLILFNDGTIFNPSHLFGIFSAFNSDIIKDIELYKSSIPAQYGGRISSVLEVNGREGNSKKITGSVGIGLLTSRAHIEGPLIKERTSFIAAVRTTYSDWLLNFLPEESGYRNGTASFRDFNLGFNHKINNNNTLYAYAYHSRDNFNFNIDTSFNYTNTNASLKWRSTLSNKHNMNLSAGYDNYRYNNMDNSNPFAAYKLSFIIQQLFLKSNFKYLLSDKHSFQYGFNALVYNLMPGLYQPLGDKSLVIEQQLEREKALESALFFSDSWNITNKFQLDLGIRYSFFNSLNNREEDNAFYHGPEFRISGRYLINEETSVKAGFNSMYQYIHMLTNTTTISPTDTWKLSDKNIKPQSGWQAAAGFYKTLNNNIIELSLEGYYKRIDNYLDYKSGAVIVMNPNIADDVIETMGKAWGVEFMLKKNIGRLNGWLSYTYSSIKLKQKDTHLSSSAINKGNWYNAHYDKPHDLKLVGNYKFTQRYSISVNLDYSTGRPVTVPIGKYYTNGGYRIYYSERNQYRIPDYFRADLAFNIEPSHNLTHLAHFTITLGVYNLTARKNPYSVYYVSEGGSVNGYMLTVFGAAIPYVNLNIRF